MCTGHSTDQQPPEQPRIGMNYFLVNLRQPGPLGWKIRRVLANNAFKIAHGQPCCGNRGEPGC